MRECNITCLQSIRRKQGKDITAKLPGGGVIARGPACDNFPGMDNFLGKDQQRTGMRRMEAK